VDALRLPIGLDPVLREAADRGIKLVDRERDVYPRHRRDG
jgi:hypothetical protein